MRPTTSCLASTSALRAATGSAGSELRLAAADGQPAGVDDDREIRPAARLVGGVDRLVGALPEAGRGPRRQVAAGGEAEHPDPGRVDAPLPSLAARQADRPLRVL